MATVHFGRLLGPVGFSRTVAIKRLHAQFAQDPEFVSMFLDEARLAARIRHPNVVPTLDVVATDGELFLVMDYVAGESLARLARTMNDLKERMPLRIVSSVMAGVLHGLHAAHEAKDERGMALGIVHRDVSPQNVLVGTDGVAKILDFGVAKAAGRVQTTREGQIKGKLAYMPPEQLRGATVTRSTDIYAAGVILWELVTGQRLFAGDSEGVVVAKVLLSDVASPVAVLRERGVKLTPEQEHSLPKLEKIILKALASEPEDRYATSKEMALELERTVPPATGSEVSEWVETHAQEVLAQRAGRVAEIESGAMISPVEPRPSSKLPVAGQDRTLPELGPASVGSNPSGSSVGPVTQPSSISVATGSSLVPAGLAPRTGSWIGVGVGAALALFIVGAVVAWRSFQTPKDAQANTAPVLSASSSPPAASTLPTTTTSAAPPPSLAALPEQPSPSVSTTTAKPPPTATSKPQPRYVPPPQPPKPNCNPPYTTDSAGIRHYKPGCI
jgi:serine/threonine-protein kinase